MYHDQGNGVYIYTSTDASRFIPSENDYGHTQVSINEKEGTLNSYVIRNEDGTVSTGTVSLESILIHEIQHAYDCVTLSLDDYNAQAIEGSGVLGDR